MRLNEQITLIARETGWSLEYIRGLSFWHFISLVEEILHQRDLERYSRAYNSATIVCTLASSRSHRYSPEELIGRPPERRVMKENNLGKSATVDKLKLADGNEYSLEPLCVNMLVELEEEFGKPFDELLKSLSMKMLRSLVFYRLRGNYPALTKEEVGRLLTVEVLSEVRKGLVS